MSFYPHGLQHVAGVPMEDTLERLRDLEVGPMPFDSHFVRPQRITFQHGARQRKWDMVRSFPSIGVVLKHSGRDLGTGGPALILVRQFRPALFVALTEEAEVVGKPAPPLSTGFSYELCAGLIDKDKSLEQIASEEIEEECGYRVPADTINRLTSYHAAIGISGSRHTLCRAAVDESMRISTGGGLVESGEAVEVLALPIGGKEWQAFATDDACPKSGGLVFALHLVASEV